MEINDSYQNNGKSSDPTNQISKEKIQRENHKRIMNSWQQGHQLKNGRYIIQKKLAGGGFADIYLASDLEENQDVIIKILKSELQSESNFDRSEENFVKEAMNLSKCQHPHIVQFRNIIKTSEGWCMVMEYIEGEDLKSWVDKNGSLLERDALAYIRQIGEALIEVHKKKLLHRDVKPRNIIRKPDGLEVVLIDFGIARKFSSNKTEQHTPYLTEDFAPIEQYRENYPRGAYTDVYALAATLYFLLTGKTPIASWRRLNEQQPLENPRQINQGKQHISEEVSNAILLGMQIYPQERPETVKKWLDLLPPALDEDKIATQPPPVQSLSNPNNSKNNSQKNQTVAITQPPTKNSPIQVNAQELSSLIAALTSPTSFLIALAIFSLLGTTLISAGFWLSLVFILTAGYFIFTKKRGTKQLIRLVISSLIPTLLILLGVPRLMDGKLQESILSFVLLTVISSLLGVAIMSLSPRIYQFLSSIFGE